MFGLIFRVFRKKPDLLKAPETAALRLAYAAPIDAVDRPNLMPRGRFIDRR